MMSGYPVDTALELKPCPFDGARAEMRRDPGSYGYTPPLVFVQCTDPGCEVEGKSFSELGWREKSEGRGKPRGHYERSEEAMTEAAEWWNRRPEIPPIELRLGRVDATWAEPGRH